ERDTRGDRPNDSAARQSCRVGHARPSASHWSPPPRWRTAFHCPFPAPGASPASGTKFVCRRRIDHRELSRRGRRAARCSDPMTARPTRRSEGRLRKGVSHMKPAWTRMMLAALPALGIGLGLAVAPLDAQQKTARVAKKVAAPPALDGTLDAAWQGADVLTIKAVGGKNLPGGSTDVSVRALYTADTVYFLMQYKDPTNSVRREPWQKQADGSWKLLKDPDDKGGDNNLYYEDKFPVAWNINSPAFDHR